VDVPACLTLLLLCCCCCCCVIYLPSFFCFGREASTV
jgi:hypothetical protein